MGAPCHHGLWAWRMVVTHRPTLVGGEQIAETRRLIAWCATVDHDEREMRAQAFEALAPTRMPISGPISDEAWQAIMDDAAQAVALCRAASRGEG